MPRPKNRVPTTQKTIQIPEDLLAKVELLTMNPVTGKMPFGFFSDLVVALIREWIAKKIQEKDDAPKRPEEHNPGVGADNPGNPRGNAGHLRPEAQIPGDENNPPGTPSLPRDETSPSDLYRNLQNLRNSRLQGDSQE